MYSERISSNINDLFSEISAKVLQILDNNTASNETVELVANSISSITTGASKTMLDDMVDFLTEEQISKLSTDADKNVIYRANLRSEIFGKYDFTVPKDCIKFNEIPKKAVTFRATAVTAGVVSGALAYVLTHISPPVAVAWIIASAVFDFLVSAGIGVATYKKIVPDLNKKKLKKAVEECLAKIQKDLIDWFNEVERYFNTRINELFSST